MLRVPDTVQHEPCGLLGDLQCPSNFVGTDSLLAVRQHPHGTQPLIQTYGGVLKDRADLDRELLPTFETCPCLSSREKRQAFTCTAGALRSFWPFGSGNSFQADHGVQKVPDSLHQTTVNIERFCFHA